MKKLLIGNGRMITRDSLRPYFENGAVMVEDGYIVECGDYDELKDVYNDAEFIDAKGGVIMPALINTHAHIYSAFARGLSIIGNNPKNFMEILDGTWWTIDRKLTKDQVKWSAMATYLDCIKNGALTVFDHHASYGDIEGSLFQISDSAREMGVRTCLCYEVSDRDGEDLMRLSVLENENFINYAKKNGGDYIKGMMGMHAPFTLSDATLEFAKEHTPKGAGYHIHVSEGIDDVYDSLHKYGKRPIERLFDMGILGRLTIAAHCIHITPAEIMLLKDTETMSVHNPESNMGNAVGIGPVLKMMEAGILLGLGTDGFTNDMLESYKVGNIIHKHHLGDPSVAYAELPKMLFSNNPHIASRYFNLPMGKLIEGYVGDIIVTDYIPPTPMNEDNINGHILFGMNGRSVTTAVCGGRVLMKDRQVLVCDENEVLRKSREAASSLWHSINDERM